MVIGSPVDENRMLASQTFLLRTLRPKNACCTALSWANVGYSYLHMDSPMFITVGYQPSTSLRAASSPYDTNAYSCRLNKPLQSPWFTNIPKNPTAASSPRSMADHQAARTGCSAYSHIAMSRFNRIGRRSSCRDVEHWHVVACKV